MKTAQQVCLRVKVYRLLKDLPVGCAVEGAVAYSFGDMPTQIAVDPLLRLKAEILHGPRLDDTLPYRGTQLRRSPVCHIIESHRLDLTLDVYTLDNFVIPFILQVVVLYDAATMASKQSLLL